MEKLKLSSKAEEVVKRLVDFKDSDKVGYIAAVDPQTGETFYGKNEVEAAKEGRRAKNDPKAVFFFVRVGYPSVHVLKRKHKSTRIYPSTLFSLGKELRSEWKLTHRIFYSWRCATFRAHS